MLRKYTEADSAQVIRIWLESSAQSHHFIPLSYWKLNAEAMRSVYLPASLTYVLENDSQILGFISFAGNTIAAIFIDIPHQRKGYGKYLIQFAKESFESLQLYVYCKNENALQFYKHQGFTIAGKTTDPNTGEEQLLMTYQKH